MATLRLLRVRCRRIGDETARLRPLFLQAFVGGPISVGAAWKNFPSSAQQSVSIVGGYLYLSVGGEVLFVSRAYVQPNDVGTRTTIFDLVDPTAEEINYQPEIRYRVEEGAANLLIATIQRIALDVTLLLKSLITLVISPFQDFVFPRTDEDEDSENDPEDQPPNR